MTLAFRAWLAAAVTAVTLAAQPVAATTVTVDLDTAPVGSYYVTAGEPGFGSQGPVSIDWSPFNDLSLDLIRWGSADYSGRHAAYCDAGGSVACAVDLFVGGSGFSVTLDSFWLGGWPYADRFVSWSVFDLADLATPVAGAVNALVSGTTGLTNVIGATSETGFRILFGPDGFNGGINDITYTYQSLNGGGGGTSPIPLPAAGWLLIAGLGGLVALRRRG